MDNTTVLNSSIPTPNVQGSTQPTAGLTLQGASESLAIKGLDIQTNADLMKIETGISALLGLQGHFKTLWFRGRLFVAKTLRTVGYFYYEYVSITRYSDFKSYKNYESVFETDSYFLKEKIKNHTREIELPTKKITTYKITQNTDYEEDKTRFSQEFFEYGKDQKDDILFFSFVGSLDEQYMSGGERTLV
jgi:hypothetical protein